MAPLGIKVFFYANKNQWKIGSSLFGLLMSYCGCTLEQQEKAKKLTLGFHDKKLCHFENRI